MLYRVRPYEAVPGSAQRLVRRVDRALREALARPGLPALRDGPSAPWWAISTRCPSQGARKPRVGVVGEILVKFHPTANNRIVDAHRGGGRGGGGSRPHGLPPVRVLRRPVPPPQAGRQPARRRSCRALAIARLELFRGPAEAGARPLVALSRRRFHRSRACARRGRHRAAGQRHRRGMVPDRGDGGADPRRGERRLPASSPSPACPTTSRARA